MSENFQQHAADLVNTFKQQLSNSAIEHVGQAHFEQLELLVESALASISLSQMEKTADQVQALAEALRNEAENTRPV